MYSFSLGGVPPPPPPLDVLVEIISFTLGPENKSVMEEEGILDMMDIQNGDVCIYSSPDFILYNLVTCFLY